jgi:hypothetical protein
VSAVGRIKNSWALAKQSWAVLRTDKELAVIPVVSFFVTLLAIAAVGGGIWVSLKEVTTLPSNSTSLEPTPITYVVGAIGYLLITFIVTFFAAALVSGAHQRLTGGNPTLGSAFAQATSRIGQIFGWAMLTGTVGLILQALRERLGFLGDIVVGAVGAAWDIVTWLAVPVVVVEGTGPVTSLKRAAHLFKQTWGENLVAQAGFGILGFLLVLPAVLVAVLLGAAIPDGMGIIIGVALAAIWIAVVSVVMSALNGIFRTALYLYATGQQTEGFFTQQQMEAAFGPKRGRR